MADPVTYNLVGNIPSPAIQITHSTGNKFIIPYSKEVSMSISHQTFEPIKEFFDFIRKTVTATADFADSSAAVGADLIFRLQDMLGLKLYNKEYFRQAWMGTKPASLSLSLDFNRGSSGAWDSKKEVYDPIQKLMALCSPEVFGIGLIGPIPGAISAFASYTAEAITNIATSLGAGKTVVVDAGVDVEKGKKATDTLQSFITGAASYVKENRTWTIQFGRMEDSTFTPYLTFRGLIIKSNSFSYSNKLSQNSNGSFYPIKGSVNLAFETQSIIVSSDFV